MLRRGGFIFRQYVNVDNAGSPSAHFRDAREKSVGKARGLRDRPNASYALSACQHREVGQRIVNPLSDPTVFSRAATKYRHMTLMPLVVQIGVVVGDQEEDGNVVV